MTYKLFIDDERFPPWKEEGEWIIARSSAEAIEIYVTKGPPTLISFDHDLGGEDTSMLFIQWWINHYIDSIERGVDKKYLRVMLPEWTVHSQNPVGASNITMTMRSFLKYLESE